MRKTLPFPDAPSRRRRPVLLRAVSSLAIRLSPFTLCLIGMTAGMAVDYRRTRFVGLDFCIGDAGPAEAIERHLAMMPAMYLGVALATAIGLCRDIGAAVAGPGGKRMLVGAAGVLGRTGLVLGGMVAATLVHGYAPVPRHPAGEWLVMTLGMLGGHAICARRRSVAGSIDG